MTLTYIFHSGFVLETEQSILVFDYWLDPSGVMDSVLRSEKPMYVFSSHFHEDHFTNEIFEWKKQKPNITYILSKDIYKHRRASKEDADVWLAKGGTWSDDNISVWAMGSTDSGVSWIVETEVKAAIKRVQSQACLDSAEREQARPKVKRIFHAGDLNNWYARFLQEVKPGETIYSEELTEQREPLSSLERPSRDGSRQSQFDEEIEPIAHEKQYLGELKDIRKITDSFDVVMFPVDGRIGNGYTLGGRQFIERFKVRHFVPMHFVASGFKSAWRMKEFTDEKNISFWKINREGETIEI